MDGDLESLRAEYLGCDDDYERAAAEMRAAMAEADEALEVVRGQVVTGKPLVDALASIQPAGVRKSLSVAADELERVRHASQRVVFAMLLEEGLTMAEIGRTFGISRSLVSRLIKERE